MTGHELLTVEEMYRADAAAAASGIASLALMEAAGTAIAREIRRRWRPRRTVVLCGPGNNGGDGFVVARLLAGRGWPVAVGLLGDVATLKGDAAVNAARWSGRIEPLGPNLLTHSPLVVDALFGAGLARPLEGLVADVIERVNSADLDCVAVDIPSGVHGDSGQILDVAPRCRATVTFLRAKPGHLLLPGRERCGERVVADIGIPEAVLALIAPRTFANGPAVWLASLPWPGPDSNKYTRGHAVVVGGERMTGAGRLAAEGARRAGAGLVSIATTAGAFPIYATGRPGTIVAPVLDGGAFQPYIADRRRHAVLIGPGAGLGEETRERVLTALDTNKACVLDADALTVFQDDPRSLFDRIRGPCVLTPHEGEFPRLFEVRRDKVGRAREAARRSGAVVLLKGPDTVIAAPDGRAAINHNAPPELATAGSGDVLAGMILGLLSQGMDAFLAACAAAWMHGEAARTIGPALIAEDILEALPLTAARLKRLCEP